MDVGSVRAELVGFLENDGVTVGGASTIRAGSPARMVPPKTWAWLAVRTTVWTGPSMRSSSVINESSTVVMASRGRVPSD